MFKSLEPYDVVPGFFAENLRNLLGLCVGTGEEGIARRVFLPFRSSPGVSDLVRRSGRLGL